MQADCTQMMSSAGGTAMMVGMGLVWLLVIALLVLGIAALVKYLRPGPKRGNVGCGSEIL